MKFKFKFHLLQKMFAQLRTDAPFTFPLTFGDNPAAVSMSASVFEQHWKVHNPETIRACPSYWIPASDLRYPVTGKRRWAVRAPLERALPQVRPTTLLTSHLSELGHVATPGCKQSWEMSSFTWSLHSQNKI